MIGVFSFLFLASAIALAVSLVLLVVRVVKKKPKKPVAVVAGASLLICLVSMVVVGMTYQPTPEQIAERERVAAEKAERERLEAEAAAQREAESKTPEEEPDTDLLWGTVILGKAAAENEEAGRRILRVIVGWSEYAVAVQVAYVNGSILPPIVEKEEEEKTEAAPKPTDIAQQVEYFTSLNPQALGLEGDDMKAYMVFPQQGWVMIDDVSCREISVYRQDAQTATNVLAGTFYLSSDLTHIYKKSDNEQIIPLQVSTGD